MKEGDRIIVTFGAFSCVGEEGVLLRKNSYKQVSKGDLQAWNVRMDRDRAEDVPWLMVEDEIEVISSGHPCKSYSIF